MSKILGKHVTDISKIKSNGPKINKGPKLGATNQTVIKKRATGSTLPYHIRGHAYLKIIVVRVMLL